MYLREHRPPPAGRRLGWLLVTGCLAAGWATAAAGQTYFKWTDSQGVVHFSDAPPSGAKGVEKLNLPAAPIPPAAAKPAPVAAGTTGMPAGAPEGAAPAARVVLTSRNAPRTGPSALQVSGEVKNVGGGSARDVLVTVVVLDASSGYECLRQELPVTPSTLGGGEAGTFDAALDSPCLLGQPKLDLTPVWVSTDRSE